MPSIQLKALTAATPDGRELFTNLDLTFGPHRTGLVGRNGTGKTTLLRIVMGEVTPKSGSVQIDGRIGVLRQSVSAGDESVAAALGIADELAQLARIEVGTGTPDDFESADWTLEARIAQSLASVGLPELDLARPVATLSGGQRTRLSLAALLLQQPDFLLLDEPTNNLDADGRTAVADLLRTWRGGAIVVSHDRELLRGMDEIVELTTVGVKNYGGNWDAYEARRAVDLAAAEHDLAHAERRLGDLERKAQERAERKAQSDSRGARMAARGGIPRIVAGGMKRAAQETAGAQVRLAERQHVGASADLAAAREEIEILQPLSVTLERSGLPAGRVVLQLDNVTGGYDGHTVIRDVSLTITGPERVAITGPNGSGKSTLLRLVTGVLTPASGAVRITPRHALLDQQVTMLDPALSIRDNYLRLNPDDTENACRAALARFMFRAEAALKPVGQLSGGEMLRAGLAATIGSSQPPELLILDEPTNHLDIHAIAAVEAGLRAYDGALIVVSHDRAFLDAIGIEREVMLVNGEW
jgi:ATPase subunit of ABC transporter with duplicated ATPase domains